MKNKYWYMVVTNDKYELPVIVCSSSWELARKLNLSRDAISSAISKSIHKGTKSQYRKVEIIEDEMWEV